MRTARLLDGTGGPALADAVVQVRGGLISYAGPAAQAPPMPDATAVDLGADSTVLPGLIDCHAHPIPHGDLPVLGPEHVRDQTRMLFAVDVLRDALASGVT